MAAPAAIDHRWKSVPVSISGARQCWVQSPTSTNPNNIVIGDVIPFERDLPDPLDEEVYNRNKYLTFSATATLKGSVDWGASAPKNYGAYLHIPIPTDLALFPDGSGGFDCAAQLEMRITRWGDTAPTDYTLRCRCAAEGFNDDPVSNFGGGSGISITPDFVYNEGDIGDQANAVFSFTNLRDANSRSLRPNDQLGVALWWREDQTSGGWMSIYFASLRYRAIAYDEAGRIIGPSTTGINFK